MWSAAELANTVGSLMSRSRRRAVQRAADPVQRQVGPAARGQPEPACDATASGPCSEAAGVTGNDVRSPRSSPQRCGTGWPSATNCPPDTGGDVPGDGALAGTPPPPRAGNQFGLGLCPLGTDIDDRRQRLRSGSPRDGEYQESGRRARAPGRDAGGDGPGHRSDGGDAAAAVRHHGPAELQYRRSPTCPGRTSRCISTAPARRDLSRLIGLRRDGAQRDGVLLRRSDQRRLCRRPRRGAGHRRRWSR